MIILKTITGLLIAAVLYVPGTTQHEVAKVGEEPVVKGEEVRQSAYWRYNNDTPAGAKLAGNYTSIPNDEDSCGEEGDVPCILEIEGSPGNMADLQNFLDDISTEEAVASQALRTKQ